MGVSTCLLWMIVRLEPPTWFILSVCNFSVTIKTE
jgi:hypothetical protein